MKKDIKVSVIMLTYNHASYLAQAIQGVVNQVTSFPIELLIYDDHSADHTQKIIREYQDKYPRIIISRLRKKNVGMMQNFNEAILHAKGKYIALCEGDDYWTNNNKLQIQHDFLESNTEYSICSHNVYVHSDTDGKVTEWPGEQGTSVSTTRDLLRHGSSSATCSLFFINNLELVNTYIELSKKISGGDWLIQIIASTHGNMYHLPQTMAVYRRHDGGASAPKNLKDKIAIYNKGGVHTCKVLDEHFANMYSKEISINLAAYFYPQLMNVYLSHNDIKNAREYARKIILTGLRTRSLTWSMAISSLMVISPLYRYHIMAVPNPIQIARRLYGLYYNSRQVSHNTRVDEQEKASDYQRLSGNIKKGLKKPIKLHIGCGPRVLKGWINIDLHYESYEKYLPYYTDKYYAPSIRGTRRDFFALNVTTTPLPFSDNSVDVIFHEDFIEHLDQEEQLLFLSEAYRVLKPGAVHRINTPNLLSPFLVGNSSFVNGMLGVNRAVWDKFTHKNVLTPTVLRELARITGYSKIEFMSRDHTNAIEIPTEYRPDKSNQSDDWNLFADLTK